MLTILVTGSYFFLYVTPLTLYHEHLPMETK